MPYRHPQFKSERREQKRDRRRFQMVYKGRPEYLRLQVGHVLRVIAKRKEARRAERQ